MAVGGGLYAAVGERLLGVGVGVGVGGGLLGVGVGGGLLGVGVGGGLLGVAVGGGLTVCEHERINAGEARKMAEIVP